MALGEFELIARYFANASAGRRDVVLGVGDDAALVRVPAGFELVAATDTLVADVHFPAGTPVESIGYRALAVNLSDFAAMGATPAWFTLALTLPEAVENWLERFSAGLLELAARHEVALVGGDTTAGPLTVTVQLLGYAFAGRAIRRSGASPGELICVSGTVGDAAAGLASLRGRLVIDANPDRDALQRRFLFPDARVQLGMDLQGIASAAIDVSDGLAADLAKLLAASGVGARIELDKLPLSDALRRSVPRAEALRHALHGGEDYELCFTVPGAYFPSLAREATVPVAAIGVIESAPGLRGVDSGRVIELSPAGFDHFQR